MIATACIGSSSSIFTAVASLLLAATVKFDGVLSLQLAGDGPVPLLLAQCTGGSQRYQGVVPIEGARLADSLQAYFLQSEQLPTRLWLHADEAGASGMLQGLGEGETRPILAERGAAYHRELTAPRRRRARSSSGCASMR